MEADKSPNDSLFEAAEILISMRNKIEDDINLLWTSYDSADEVRKELDSYITGIHARNIDSVYRMATLFIPTCEFQTLAIDNGWGDEYLKLADRFDLLYNQLLIQLKKSD